MIKKIKCDVCGYGYKIQKGMVKVAIEPSGALDLFSTKKTYSVIDCPLCGCQKVLGERLPVHQPDEAEDEEAEEVAV